MTPNEALQILHNLVEQMPLNGSQRNTAREAAQTLQGFIQLNQQDGVRPAEQIPAETAAETDGD